MTQRINFFPNPKLNPPYGVINQYGDVNVSKNYNNGQLEVSGTDGGYGFDFSVPADTDLVFRCYLVTNHEKNQNPCAIYALEANSNLVTKCICRVSVTQDNNDPLLARFHSPATGRVRIEFYPDAVTVNITNMLVERADTYDVAVGGASKLLHGRHHAAQLRVLARRVTADDGHQSDRQSTRDGRTDSGRICPDLDNRENGWRAIPYKRLRDGQRGWRIQSRWRGREVQQVAENQLDHHGGKLRANVPSLECRFRQSESLRYRNALPPGGRVSGKQAAHRQHRVLRRGYDAARLTPLGVAA